MNLKGIHNVYFVGIGGIGMSALARYFKQLGKSVSGYDKTETKITASLQQLNINICFNDAISLIPKEFTSKNTLVVYTPAIPKSNLQLQYFKQQQYTIKKRAEVLGIITKNSFCFAVAGTHGKTTTSAILGHLLKICNANMTAFLGGITENYHSNLILNGSDISVVEADEFDRSFLQLSPNVACITSMDADHLDIYGAADALEQSFIEFSNKLVDKSKLFVAVGVALKGITYGVNTDTDFAIQNVKIKDGSYYFDIKTPSEIIENIVFNLPGKHNLSNALVAFAMAYDYGFNKEDLIKGLESFKGVERRFTYQIKTNKFVFIDDYAHHPTEINAVHQAVREMYPDQKVMAIFQPHLFSRTQDFADEFAESLDQFDVVRLLEIYPARELPIEGVNTSWLLDKMKHSDKKIITKKQIVSEINANSATVILTIGAGDIGAEINRIKKELTTKL